MLPIRFMPFTAHSVIYSESHFDLRLSLLRVFVWRGVHCVMAGRMSEVRDTETVTAAKLSSPPDRDGFPMPAAWSGAHPIAFDHDWQGKHADPLRETEVRILWTPETLYLKFVAHYRNITVFPSGEADGRRDDLWNRDVAEVFLQPAGSETGCYKEFEVSPNGLWIDLDIARARRENLRSGLKRGVAIDGKNKTWQAELALPMKSLTAQFNPQSIWRVNFYRVEGTEEPRFYSAWRPTGTPTPNFHVPESFGKLLFKS